MLANVNYLTYFNNYLTKRIVLLQQTDYSITSINQRGFIMQLGTQTGSLVNHLYTTKYGYTVETIEIGMPATITGWTDRYAATVTDIFKVGKSHYVTIQQDTATVVGGTGYGDEVYEYERNPNGCTSTFKIDGTLKPVYLNHNNRWVKGRGGAIIGRREEYRDPSF